MDQGKEQETISPISSPHIDVPPSTPDSNISRLQSPIDESSQNSPDIFRCYSYTNVSGDKQKDLEHLPPKGSDLTCNGGPTQKIEMQPKPVSEEEETKTSISDNTESISQGPPVSSPSPTPDTPSVALDKAVDKEQNESHPTVISDKKTKTNPQKPEPVGLKSRKKAQTKGTIKKLRTGKEKGIVSLFTPNISPTISSISLYVPKSSLKLKVKSEQVSVKSRDKGNEVRRKRISRGKICPDTKSISSAEKGGRKKSIAPSSSHRKKPPAVSAVAGSASPRYDRSTNTTPHKYRRIPSRLEAIRKSVSSIAEDNLTETFDIKDKARCLQHLEAIYRNSGLRVNSSENERCMTRPGSRQNILSCPAFMQFSHERRRYKMGNDSKITRTNSSEDDVSPSPYKRKSPLLERKISPAFSRHIKETWTNSLHCGTDQSDTDCNTRGKQKYSKTVGFDCNRGKESIEQKRSVRFSMGTPTDTDEPVHSEEDDSQQPNQQPSSKEKQSKRSPFRNRLAGSASRSDDDSQKLDSSIKTSSAFKRVFKYMTSRKSSNASIPKSKAPKTMADSSIPSTEEGKPRFSATNTETIDCVRENQNEPFMTEEFPRRKTKLKSFPKYIEEDKSNRDTATESSRHSLGGTYKNRKKVNQSRKAFGDGKYLHDSEISSDKVSSSDDVFYSATNRSRRISSNSDRRSTTPSTTDILSTSSAAFWSSAESETKFGNSSDVAATIVHDVFPQVPYRSAEPMYEVKRKNNLSHSIKQVPKENKRRSPESVKYVNRGSSPVGFDSESLLNSVNSSVPSSARSKSTFNSFTAMSVVESVSKAQQTVPCVNLQYPTLKTVFNANDAESDYRGKPVKSSSKSSILMPKKRMPPETRTSTRKNNITTNNQSRISLDLRSKISRDTYSLVDISSMEKRDIDTPIHKNRTSGKSKVSQKKRSVNNDSNQKRERKSDLSKASRALREQQSAESVDNTKAATKSSRKGSGKGSSKPNTREKRQPSLKFRRSPTLRQVRRHAHELAKKHQRTNIYSFTTENEEISIHLTPEFVSPLKKRSSFIVDELKKNVSSSGMGRQQNPSKVAFHRREPRVESKVKCGNTSTTQIGLYDLQNKNAVCVDLLKDRASLSGMIGKQISSEVSFPAKGSGVETKAKTGYLVEIPVENANSKKTNPQALKDKLNSNAAKEQKAPSKVPVSPKRRSTETKQRRSRSFEGIQLEEVSLEDISGLTEILKCKRINLGSSNEGQIRFKVPTLVKGIRIETRDKPENTSSGKLSLKKHNSLSVVEVPKHKTNMIVNGRHSSKTSSDKANSVESKSIFSRGSFTQVENKVLNKVNQETGRKRCASRGQVPSKVSGNQNLTETKTKSGNTATNIEEKPLKKPTSLTVTRLTNGKSASTVNKRKNPSKIAFSGNSESEENKPKSVASLTAKFDDNSLKEQNSTVVDQSLKVKRSVSVTNGRLPQSKFSSKVLVEDEKFNSRMVSSTKKGEPSLISTKKVLKTQNTTNSNSQKHKTINTAKKGPPISSKVKSAGKQSSTDVKSTTESLNEEAIQPKDDIEIKDTESSSGPKLLGSEDVSSSTLPTHPFSYTVNTCLLPGYQVWPGYLEHGSFTQETSPSQCGTSRDIVCFPRRENTRYLNDVYYAVPVMFPYVGNALRHEGMENFGRGRSYESLDIGETYYLHPNRTDVIYSPGRFKEVMNAQEWNCPVCGSFNERNSKPDPSGMDMSLFVEVSRSGTSINENLHPRDKIEGPVSLPSSRTTFSAGKSFLPHKHWWD